VLWDVSILVRKLMLADSTLCPSEFRTMLPPSFKTVNMGLCNHGREEEEKKRGGGVGGGGA
jgi:hypothetical protein